MAQRSARIVRDDDIMGGEPRIEGRRLAVRQIVEWVEEGGMSAQSVADRYDLDVADVYRALTYYHEHPDEMAKIERRRECQERQALENGTPTLADLRDAGSEGVSDEA